MILKAQDGGTCIWDIFAPLFLLQLEEVETCRPSLFTVYAPYNETVGEAGPLEPFTKRKY